MLADAPTELGQNLRGRGKPIKNTGRVNKGRSGAERTTERKMTAKTTGTSTRLNAMIHKLELILVFLSVQEVTRSTL